MNTYIIIFKFFIPNKNETKYLTFEYSNLEYAESQISILRDRYTSIGCKILKLRLFRAEYIECVNQV